MCDTMVVVWPDAIGFAKNSDRDPNEAQRLDWIPAAQHQAGAMLRCTWTTIPQVPHTRAVLLSRPFWTWGAEMGTNDTGLVIGNEAVFTWQPIDCPGLTGLDLVRLALERCDSVDQAIATIAELIERHGQGGRAGYSYPSFQYHNSFLIADGNGASVLESAGRQVAVEKINAGARAISNGLTIPSIQKQSDRLRSRVAQCAVRRATMEQLGSKSTGPQDLAKALRCHGTTSDGWPQYRRLNGALGAPCVHFGGMVAGSQTVGSWISILRPGHSQHWATGTSAPCISLFRPISNDRPRDLGDPQGFFDSSSLWWRFEALHRKVMRDWKVAEEFLTARDAAEQNAFDNPLDEDTHWLAADQWLERFAERVSDVTDRRPKWLQRRWEWIHAEARAGNRLPPRLSI